MAKKRKADAPLSDSATKGQIVERIVASMHQSAGVEVERNVLLPTPSKEKREIDVLLKAQVVGYPIRFAIECKNYNANITAEQVGGFIDKLNQVGIPPQCGIMVSVRGFQRGAKKRAQEVGMRLLLLTGLTKDRLKAKVESAIQSIVFLLPNLLEIKIKHDPHVVKSLPGVPDTPEGYFAGEDGTPLLSVPDTVWSNWHLGYSPDFILNQNINLVMGDDHYYIVSSEKLFRVKEVSVKVAVVGYVITRKGESTTHTLINIQDNRAEKIQSNVSLDSLTTKFEVKRFDHEEDLKEFFQSQQDVVQIVTRVRLPRIWFDAFYWPPSERVEKLLQDRLEDYKNGKINTLQFADVTEVEGDDLKAAWEPISPNYPAQIMLMAHHDSITGSNPSERKVEFFQ